MRHIRSKRPRLVVAMYASFLLAGCSTSRPSGPSSYAQAARDSATQAAATRPALSTAQVGEKFPVVPPLMPTRTSMSSAPAVVDASKSLNPELQRRINEALAECADMARAEVMLQHFAGRSPTREECNEVVDENSRAEPITRAMQLGVEQHQLGLQCAEEKLKELKPRGYSLSPRYRYDPVTGKAEFIPREAVNELLRRGRGAELKGTLEPDIVLHAGAPHQVQATYDYKFPCMNTDKRSRWRDYTEGRADGISNQGTLYQKALKVKPARVQPHLGVY